MIRVVKYPIVVFVIGILLAIIVPILFNRIDPSKFSRLVGRFTFDATIVAIIIGFICDRRHKKKSQENK